MVPHLDALSDDAAALEAVNTVVFEDGRAIGHNTDTTGFAESFARGLPDAALEQRRAARRRRRRDRRRVRRAAARARQLTIVDVDRGAPRRCVRRLLDRAAAGDARRASTRPTGSSTRRRPAWRRTPACRSTRSCCAPACGSPRSSTARSRPSCSSAPARLGCRTLDGGGMAVFQAAARSSCSPGLEPDRERMLRHFAELAAGR